MEDFEQKALDTAPTNPHVYVDDMFTVLHEYAIKDFTDHINSQSECIKFTIEAEQGGQLPFLDTLMIVNKDSMLKTKMYHKPAHTDQYVGLGFRSPPGAQEIGSLHPAEQGRNNHVKPSRCEGGGETCEESADCHWILKVR